MSKQAVPTAESGASAAGVQAALALPLPPPTGISALEDLGKLGVKAKFGGDGGGADSSEALPKEKAVTIPPPPSAEPLGAASSASGVPALPPPPVVVAAAISQPEAPAPSSPPPSFTTPAPPAAAAASLSSSPPSLGFAPPARAQGAAAVDEAVRRAVGAASAAFPLAPSAPVVTPLLTLPRRGKGGLNMRVWTGKTVLNGNGGGAANLQ